MPSGRHVIWSANTLVSASIYVAEGHAYAMGWACGTCAFSLSGIPKKISRVGFLGEFREFRARKLMDMKLLHRALLLNTKLNINIEYPHSKFKLNIHFDGLH